MIPLAPPGRRGPAQILPPLATASDACRAELDTLMQNQARLTDAQRAEIDCWGGGVR